MRYDDEGKKRCVMIKKIDHLVITANDVESCLAFYAKLGFVSRQAGARYELFAGDFKINVHLSDRELSPHARNVQPGSADVCFEITGDMAAWKNHLEEQGLSIELGVVERNGVNGNMDSIYLRDPDGNLVEFCSYREQSPEEALM